jgi:hypothetical protein
MPLVIHPRIGKGLRRVAALTALACFAGPAAAQAACPTPPTVKAFQAFGDSSDYFLAPNGGFESGATSWTLSNASVGYGNESHFLRSASDSHSLRIVPGGKAVSAAICLDTTRTGYRFFARQAGYTAGPDLMVSVRFTGADGITREQQIDQLTGANYRSWTPSRFWAPSTAAQIFQAIGFTANDTASVRLVFTAENETGPSWQIDDLYVDPYRTG